jgi:hypothetical protein
LLLPALPAAAQRACDQFRSNTTTAPQPITEMISGQLGKRVYLCGWVLINSGQSISFTLYTGTGVNCADNQTVLLNTLSMPPNTVLANRIATADGEYSPQGHSLCLQVTGSGNISAIWYWAQF